MNVVAIRAIDDRVSTAKRRNGRQTMRTGRKQAAPATGEHAVKTLLARVGDLEQRLARTDDQVRDVFDRMDDATLERFVWED